MRIDYDKDQLAYALANALTERDDARKESEEQARLLGMSAEREESLRGKLFMLERELARLKEAAKAVVNRWELPSWKDSEPTAVVIYKLRDTLNLED